ncbi:tRNA-dihydrouridine synthase family protein [Bacteroides sp. 51]|uniref:tRNA-dihydrouridine synthase family protein n=1 Tax=Bacteroides sp. 51 TaxID=2302938 RepID=UPI0013D4A919|nr:tRNA-dihydrouridine synthase family protein [Bacteroides sp. 51]NDV80534.1 tRNA-dihydrouridine synthase family protein [Bacteroides sp. 51]
MIPIHFAPLQGYTEAPYRNFHASSFGGVDAYYTPFVRIEKGEFRRKELRDIDPGNNTVPRLIPQLIASTPDEMKRIAGLFIEQGYREVDINMGCPFPLIAHRHKGSGILPYPDEVKMVLETMHQYPGIRFSIKMRLGWESKEESMRLLPLLNDLPLSHITLHPRIGKQQYKGSVDMDGFTAFYEQCKHPVIYNGDIETLEDLRRITSFYPNLSGVMVGRGLLANPALALEFKEERVISLEEKRRRIQELHEGVFNYYKKQIEGGDAQLLNKMKTFWEYLWPDADKKLKKSIQKSSRLSAYEQSVQELW